MSDTLTAPSPAPSETAPPALDLTSEAGLLAALEEHPEALTGVPADPVQEEASPGDAATEGKQEESKATEPPKDDPVAKEREALEAEKARLAREREEFEAARSAKDSQGYTPEDYEAAAKKFEDEGNDEMAGKARQQANNLRVEQQRQRIVNAHTRSLQELVKKYPDLNKPDSGLYKRLSETLKARPVLFSYPEGMSDAVEACAAQEAVAEVGTLREQVSKLKQELAAKEKLLHPTPGIPSPDVGEGQSLSSMSVEEADKALLAQLVAAERRGVSVFNR